MAHQPTQADVARAAGVSRGAVSMALSGSAGVSEDTRRRIIEAAERIGYVRNIGAAALAGSFASSLGVVLPDLRNPYYEGLVASIQARSSEADLLPLIVTALEDPALEATILRRLHEQRVAGIILVSPVEPSDQLVEFARRLPLTVVGTEPIGGTVDVVHMDEDRAARLVADHIRTRGWTRALHLSGTSTAGDTWVERRRLALAEAFRGLPFTQVRVPSGGAITPILAAHDVEDRDRPLAIITHNDLLAIDVVPAVHAMGLTPGRDVAILSYDDTHMANRPEWSLTSVHQDTDDLARTAVENILTRQESPSSLGTESIITPTLTVRSTS
ncbi:LacI family DNA-binding transcriptional regulator [Raineyella sp. W15-4]|uniref:LacI family DNA-binding transcriptional regulator n=1 Tax=Raineyella sp. W15-4 TaxID=3081651 RepID=UPI0029545F6B|nr:LacI family DNA-binding transcriptional regulator [Raineyella sp. W15-4]WOQ17200.1 LacI family DNA-binding transcriptional regulator [Raineyella sp. W15-4]